MPAQVFSTVENNFTKGLITESTGLNFPENAATSTDNCVYTLVGDVTRRLGMNYETNFSFQNLAHGGAAVNTYKWDNAGGDGNTQIVVTQVGTVIMFYRSSAATQTNPLSNQLLLNTLDLSTFASNGFDPSIECQFADGNGYLFIFHPNIDTRFVSYNPDTLQIASTPTVVNIRDFYGVKDGLAANTRPGSTTSYHNYNLQNQGWTAGNAWGATSGDVSTGGLGNHSWNVGAGITGITLGQIVSFSGNFFGNPLIYVQGTGTVVAYSGGVLTLSVSYQTGNAPSPGLSFTNWQFTPVNTGYINSFQAAEGVYPSNADVWWYFKDSTGVFNPGTTAPNVTLSVGNAPKGHFLLNAFNMDRSSLSGVSNINAVTTTLRPSHGAWFQGRLWFSGLNDSSQAQVDVDYYTWSENIYFSQIVQTSADFGNCYQVNDPTSEQLFDLLPTDGGVIAIKGSGQIYKLFPIQNGLLVFAANGIWFITGSQGIGFAANDYTIVKLSEVKCTNYSSYVNVLGLPYFWNEEGIYQVQANQTGSLQVNPITVGTILQFYNDIPLQSRRYARGAYDPVEYVLTWIYRSTPETSSADRYEFDRQLNFNTYNKAFFPYTIEGTPNICGITYVSSPGGSNAPDPAVKFYTVDNSNRFTFSELNDDSYLDFVSFDTVGTDYTSFFITGYKLRGQAIKRFQVQYVNMFSRMNDAENGYTFQTIWDFSNTQNSNRWSTIQYINNIDTRFDTVFRRHKVRGMGYALQFKVSSITGQPFDIQGWAVTDVVNQGT